MYEEQETVYSSLVHMELIQSYYINRGGHIFQRCVRSPPCFVEDFHAKLYMTTFNHIFIYIPVLLHF
jgi:hypothetical protein